MSLPGNTETPDLMLLSISGEVYDSDNSSSTDSAAEELAIEPSGRGNTLYKVTEVCKELKMLKNVLYIQEQKLKKARAELREVKVELREANEDLEGMKQDYTVQQGRLRFLGQAAECERAVRSAYVGRFRATQTKDCGSGLMMGMWKANAAADALLYLEGVRDDHRTFGCLYGMRWEEVLEVETSETMHVLNAFAHSQVERISTVEYMRAAGAFYRLYDESTPEQRLAYPSQMSSPLRLAYNHFWGQHRKISCT